MRSLLSTGLILAVVVFIVLLVYNTNLKTSHIHLDQFFNTITERRFVLNQTGNTNQSVSEFHDKNSTNSQTTTYSPISTDEDINFNTERVYYVQKSETGKKGEIPKIIHFVWTDEIIPSIFVENIQSFLSLNPTWQYYFWTYQSGRNFIEKHNPELLDTFDNYKHQVSKSDALRYVVLYHLGGAYFDLDTTCIKSLDKLIEGEECILTPEPAEHAVFVLQIEALIANSALLCKPKHSLFKYVIEQLYVTGHNNDMMEAAGPLFLTAQLKSYILQSAVEPTADRENDESIHVVSYELFEDLIKEDVHSVMLNYCSKSLNNINYNIAANILKMETCVKWRRRGGVKRNISSRAVAVHVHFGSYDKKKQKHFIFRNENNINNIIPNVKHYDKGNIDIS